MSLSERGPVEYFISNNPVIGTVQIAARIGWSSPFAANLVHRLGGLKYLNIYFM